MQSNNGMLDLLLKLLALSILWPGAWLYIKVQTKHHIQTIFSALMTILIGQ